MAYTLHILNSTARLIKAFDTSKAEAALGIPQLTGAAKLGEEVFGLKSRRMAEKLMRARHIQRYDFIEYSTRGLS
jgi:hypothetical protein